jgi:acetyltransferase-like isoleucine patch superfamily enzyme
MGLNAIIILGGADDRQEQIAGFPLAALDVLGRAVLLRVVDRLARFGISSPTVISEPALQLPSMPKGVRVIAQGPFIWQTAVRAFSESANDTAGLTLVLRLGPYAEIDYEDLIRFHVAQNRPVTAVLDPKDGQSNAFVFSVSPANEALYLLRHQLKTSRHPHSVYIFSGYSNPLRNAADLRRLAIDYFCRNATELTPEGVEVRPGLWVASGAVIHNRARIVAPAYIGGRASVQAAAVVTRCSILEHHAHVGAGAVVDNATLLPNTKIGHTLEIANAVVGFRRIAHLGRNVEVEISDHRLVGSVSAAPVRLLEQVASLAAYLPLQFFRGLVSSNGNRKVSPIRSAPQSPYSALTRSTDEEFPANLAGVRRYGDD